MSAQSGALQALKHSHDGVVVARPTRYGIYIVRTSGNTLRILARKRNLSTIITRLRQQDFDGRHHFVG